MPTTVTKTIGTSSRDYATLALWIAACPANLVTSDQVFRGEMYNDAEFTANATNLCAITGITSDATRYIILTAASGQSFQDAGGVRSNALTYNQSNGVGIRNTNTGNYCAGLINCNTNYTKILRLQISQGTSDNLLDFHSATNMTVKDNLILGGANSSLGLLYMGTNSSVYNCLIVCNTTKGAANRMVNLASGVLVEACTIASRQDLTNTGAAFRRAYSYTSNVTSCAIFGFSACVSTGGGTNAFGASSGYNATDLASGLPGSTANQHSVTWSATTPFVRSDNTGTDFRSIASTTLAANGIIDATNAPSDISAYARANPPTIGAWEITASASGTYPGRIVMMRQAVNRASTY